MRKKFAAVTLAITLSACFAAQNAGAASCPPHEHTRTFSEPGAHYTTQHRVYRNLYVDGVQAYSLCTVTNDVVLYHMYCSDCGKKLNTDQVTISKHSLANDPDHKD